MCHWNNDNFIHVLYVMYWNGFLAFLYAFILKIFRGGISRDPPEGGLIQMPLAPLP